MGWFSGIFSADVAIIFASACALAWLYLCKKWDYLNRLNIPHDPPSLLTLGNASNIFSEAYTLDLQNKAKHGPVWGYYLMTSPTLVVHDLDVIRKMYNGESENFSSRQRRVATASHRLLRDGLILSNGERMKRTRATVTPAFPPERLKKISGKIEQRVDDAIKRLEAREVKPGDGVRPLRPRDTFARLVLDCMCSAVFGTDVYYQDESKTDSEVPKTEAPEALLDSDSTSLLIAHVFPHIVHHITEIFRKLKPKTSNEFFFKNLAKFLNKRWRENAPHKEKFDLLHHMMKSEISQQEVDNGAKFGLTARENFANTMVFAMASYANPVNHSIYLAYNLAQHPQIQAQVQEEIDDLLKSNGQLDYDGVNSLKFLDMCLKESLRLYTPMPRLSRVCNKETTIKGITFPTGIAINIPCHALSHDPEYWDDPYAFKPERMRDMSKIDPIIYQPFGGGPRECIGFEYGKLMIKMTISKMLQKFSFKPTPNTPKPPLRVVLKFFTRPASEIELLLAPREFE